MLAAVDRRLDALQLGNTVVVLAEPDLVVVATSRTEEYCSWTAAVTFGARNGYLRGLREKGSGCNACCRCETAVVACNCERQEAGSGVLGTVK